MHLTRKSVLGFFVVGVFFALNACGSSDSPAQNGGAGSPGGGSAGTGGTGSGKATCQDVCKTAIGCLPTLTMSDCLAQCASLSQACMDCMATLPCSTPTACDSICSGSGQGGSGTGGSGTGGSGFGGSGVGGSQGGTGGGGPAGSGGGGSTCSSSTTFSCKTETCKLTQLCYIGKVQGVDTPQCVDVPTADQCTPCSTQMSAAPACPATYQKKASGSSSSGCTVTCE